MHRARYPDARPGDLLVAVQTDWWMRTPIFDALDPELPLPGVFLGNDPPQLLADTMHAGWVSFATNGDRAGRPTT